MTQKKKNAISKMSFYFVILLVIVLYISGLQAQAEVPLNCASEICVTSHDELDPTGYIKLLNRDTKTLVIKFPSENTWGNISHNSQTWNINWIGHPTVPGSITMKDDVVTIHQTRVTKSRSFRLDGNVGPNPDDDDEIEEYVFTIQLLEQEIQNKPAFLTFPMIKPTLW